MAFIDCTEGVCAESGILHQSVNALFITRLFCLSSLVLFLYDIIISIDHEVSLMWPSRLNLGKILFFLIRYCTLGTLIFVNVVLFLKDPSEEICNSWASFQWISGIILSLMTELTLELRVYAMYGKSRAILTLLALSTVITVTFCLVNASRVIQEETPLMIRIGQDTVICDVTGLPALHKSWWIPALSMELMLFALAAFKGIQTLKKHGAEGPISRLSIFLVKDSVLYFLSVFAIYLVAQLFWIFKSVDYMEVPVGFTFCMEGMMSQRLLLNIRALATAHGHDSHSDRENIVFLTPSQSQSDNGRTHSTRITISTVVSDFA